MIRVPWWLALLLALLAVAAVLHARDSATDASTRADSLATEYAAAEMRNEGFATALVSTTETWRDSTEALRERLEEAGARSVALAQVTATSTDTVTVPAQVDTASVVEPWADSVKARMRPARAFNCAFEQGPLSGEVQLGFSRVVQVLMRPGTEAACDIRYTLALPVEVTATEAADGRVLFGARTPYDKVDLQVEGMAWRAPESDGGVPWRWLIGGLAAGVVGWELAR